MRRSRIHLPAEHPSSAGVGSRVVTRRVICVSAIPSVQSVFRLFEPEISRYEGVGAPEWRNGRRSGFKIRRRKAWGFDSPLGHHFLSALDLAALDVAKPYPLRCPDWLC